MLSRRNLLQSIGAALCVPILPVATKGEPIMATLEETENEWALHDKYGVPHCFQHTYLPNDAEYGEVLVNGEITMVPLYDPWPFSLQINPLSKVGEDAYRTMLAHAQVYDGLDYQRYAKYEWFETVDHKLHGLICYTDHPNIDELGYKRAWFETNNQEG